MADPKRHAPRGPVKKVAPPIELATHDAHPRKCTAKSGRTKRPCQRWAIAGGTVCPFHGGSAPQVKASAMERLMALQHPAIDRLTKLINLDEFPTVAYAASRDVLDRTLGKAHESVSVTGKDEGPLEIVIRKPW